MKYKGEYDPSFLLDPVSIFFDNHQSASKFLLGELLLVPDQKLYSVAGEAQVCVLLGLKSLPR
jgi:hypothetical protein